VVGDLLADALPQQPLQHAGLAGADHDHVGVALLGQADDRFGRLAYGRDELGLDAAALQGGAGPGELLAPLVTTSLAPRAVASSAARSSARVAGSVSS
jgi:hypothetical protein